MTDVMADTENANPPALCRTGAYRRTVSVRPFPRLVFIGAVLAVTVLLLGFAAPVRAADTDFLSNLGASMDNQGALGGSTSNHEKFILFQGFHAGASSADFKLRSVKIRLKTEPPSGGFIRGALCDETNTGEPNSSNNSSCLEPGRE